MRTGVYTNYNPNSRKDVKNNDDLLPPPPLNLIYWSCNQTEGTKTCPELKKNYLVIWEKEENFYQYGILFECQEILNIEDFIDF